MTKKNSKRWITPASTELFNTILKLETLEDAQNFFRDLLTENEIIEFSQRWKVAEMLERKVPYKQIEKETKMSPNTIARVNRYLKRGYGGYGKMLKAIK